MSKKEEQRVTYRTLSVFRTQSGVALVVAILMLLILTLMGTASIMTSTHEIKLSGSKRGSTDAFYATDGAIHYVLADIENFDLSSRFVPVDPKTLPDDLRDYSIDKVSMVKFSLPRGVHFVDPPRVTIFHVQQRNVPRGSGFSSIGFEYEHFIIDSVGRDQRDVGSFKASSHIREKVVSVRPTYQGGY